MSSGPISQVWLDQRKRDSSGFLFEERVHVGHSMS